jgi:hypothetical protein
MAGPMPLSALLSQALVAYTIEFDNEFEQRMPHRTSTGPAAASKTGPWLVSMAMWSNFMGLLPADGRRFGEMDREIRLTNLAGLERWGYVTVAPDLEDLQPRPLRADWTIRPTRAGRLAQDTWQPLAELVDGRWRDRLGRAELDGLRDELERTLGSLRTGTDDLPDYLPVLPYSTGMRIAIPPGSGAPGPTPDHEDLAASGLAAPLSKLLIAWALQFEQGSAFSLAISANPLRVLGPDPIRLRDLPHLSGVSKEAIKASLGPLRHRAIVVERDPATGRGEVVRLTPPGLAWRADYFERSAEIEQDWIRQVGTEVVASLRARLERLAVAQPDGPPRLFEGLEPYPNGWRAAVRRPAILPHFPMVLHRGGFPDGS